MTVDVICSWCNKILRTKSMGKDYSGKACETHTICNSCKEAVLREYKNSLKQTKLEHRHDL